MKKENEVKCCGQWVKLFQLTGLVDGTPENVIILLRAWVPHNPWNRNTNICPPHRAFFTSNFAQVVKYFQQCLYTLHDHEAGNVVQESIKRVTLDLSKRVRLQEPKQPYAPFMLPVCRACEKKIKGEETTKRVPKAEQREPEVQPQPPSKPFLRSQAMLEIPHESGEPSKPQSSLEPMDDSEPMDHSQDFHFDDSQPMDHEHSFTQGSESQIISLPSSSQGAEARGTSSTQASTTSNTQASNASTSTYVPSDNSQDKDYNPLDDEESKKYPGIEALNHFLEVENMKARMASRLHKSLTISDESRRRHFTNLLSDVIVATCHVISPNANFSLEVFQATMESGKVEKKLVDTPVMPKVVRENIEYYNRSWSPDDQVHAVANLYKLGFKFIHLVIWNVKTNGNPCWTPALTEYRWTKSKMHHLLNGHAMAPVIHMEITRSRIPDSFALDFYQFVTSSEVTARVAFGTYQVKDSSGKAHTVVKNIRKCSTEELIRKLKSHLKYVKGYEDEHIPSRTFLRDCLTVLPATRSKKMHGITAAIEYGK